MAFYLSCNSLVTSKGPNFPSFIIIQKSIFFKLNNQCHHCLYMVGVTPLVKFICLYPSLFYSLLNKITAYTYNDIEIGLIKLPIGRQYAGAVEKITLWLLSY
jgi:hypothetical protein